MDIDYAKEFDFLRRSLAIIHSNAGSYLKHFLWNKCSLNKSVSDIEG